MVILNMRFVLSACHRHSDSYQKQMRGLSSEGRQQGGQCWRGQEGPAGAGEGGGAAVVTKGFWVVAVYERGVAAHGGGLTA